MSTLSAFAPDVCRLLGVRNFSYFYVASALASELLDAFMFINFSKGEGYSLGASGAISSLITFYCLSFPKSELQVGGVVTCKAPVAALVWVAQELFSLFEDDGIGHGAHLGGTIFGAMVWAITKLARLLYSPRNKRKMKRYVRKTKILVYQIVDFLTEL